MPLEEPSWWYRNPNAIVSHFLQPLASVYGMVASQRSRRAPDVQLPIPVICIGNFTAGGTGKTPFAIWMARYLRDLGLAPVFLSRGYGGRLTGPHLVQAGIDSANDVGDEPLLLSKHAPTVISKDRGRAGEFIAAKDLGNVIVMDDGLQNPSLRKDLVISVVSVSRGVGNGKVIPAGPLRMPLAQQLAVTDVVVFNSGSSPAEAGPQSPVPISDWLPGSFEGLTATARVKVRGDVSWIKERSILAFAGIGNPDRFYRLLRQMGGDVQEVQTFRDHQQLSDKEATALVSTAHDLDCQLVTTEKDLARIDPTSKPQTELRAQSRSLDIDFEIVGEGAEQLRNKIRETVLKT